MARLRFGSFALGNVSERLRVAAPANRAAILAGAVWAVLVLSYAGGYFGAATEDQAGRTVFLDTVFFFIALLLPLGLIGLAAWLAAELARQREAVAALVAASGPLSEALAETRSALAADGPLTPRELERVLRDALAKVQAELGRDLGRAIEEQSAALGEGQRRLGTMLASTPSHPPPRSHPPAPTRPQVSPRTSVAPAAKPAETTVQPDLPSMAPPPEAELSRQDLLRALDFPRDADDREGFRALRRALQHHGLAQMLQAAEDVMNLLSQEGVYMDDLAHEPGPPEAWRAFAEGRRGPELETVGGIRDAGALEVVQQLMKRDGIFRDTALFFQRRFDAVLGEIAPRLDDAALVALADTRSGRAFMLCARASGSFG